MLVGLRASDAPTIQQLIGNDQRLLMRIGALLQAHLAITQPVLEELERTPALRNLLMDRQLQEIGAEAFEDLLTKRDCTDLDLALSVGKPGDDGASWRVISFLDEIDNPLLATSAPDADASGPSLSGVSDLLPTLAPQVRAPVEGLLQAQADDQRAAALEQLRYASPSLELVSELMPMVLADGADLVRERAIALVVAAGARPVVVDLIRAIQRNDADASERLAEGIDSLDGPQLDLVLSAVLAALGRGNVTQALVVVATHLANHIASHRGLERLLELLLPHARHVSLIGLVRALQAYDHDRVDSALRGLLDQGDDLDARLITLLAHPERPGHQDLIQRGVDLLLSADEEPKDRMALAAALRRLGDLPSLATAIADRGALILNARESTVYWLLAELCRADAVSIEAATRLAKLLRQLATRQPGPHLVAVLEQQLPSLLPAEPAVLSDLVEPFIELVTRFRDKRSQELVGEVIFSMGKPSITPLWNLLEEHPQQKVRELAATILTDLHHADNISADEASAAVKRLTKVATSATQRAEKGTILAGAAAISQLPSVTDASLGAMVDEAAHGLGDQALATWGHLAAGPHINPGRRAEIIELVLVGITAELPDLPAQELVDPNTQDTTYVLDSRLGSHTYSVPVMLAAARRMGSSPHVPAPLVRRLVGELCRHWKRVASWEVIWGPGNIQDLGQTLGFLAKQQEFPSNLRLQVAEALLPRVTQLAIAATLGEVFVNGDGPALNELAARAAKAMIQATSREEFADDERGELADVLVTFLSIPDFGEEEDIVRRRLAGLIATYRSHLSMRSRERLKDMVPKFNELVAERLSWVSS